MCPTSSDREAAAGVFDRIRSIRLDRDGGVCIDFADGRRAMDSLGRRVFEPTSAVASTIYVPSESVLRLRTSRDDEITVQLPLESDLAPRRGRAAIYLDQNHWSTLTLAAFDPARITDARERDAAQRLTTLAEAGAVPLPMSSAHMSETCKQVDYEARYQRALTMVRLSAGWQLRDPLALRRVELAQAFTAGYGQPCLIAPPAITLEPNAILAGRSSDAPDLDPSLPQEARWMVHCLRSIGAIVDTMLDAESVPSEPSAGWTTGFQQFAGFLATDPTERELRRRRTHLKFIADLAPEIAYEAHRAGITPEQLSEWVLGRSEVEVLTMPCLGLFREVLHEKLSDSSLRWEENDLVDMIYLTAGAAYCDRLVGENRHAAYLENAQRRLARPVTVHRKLRTLVEELEPA